MQLMNTLRQEERVVFRLSYPKGFMIEAMDLEDEVAAELVTEYGGFAESRKKGRPGREAMLGLVEKVWRALRRLSEEGGSEEALGSG